MDSFPLFVKLAGRPCLVVGATVAALAKVELLLKAGARVTVATDDAAALSRFAGRVEMVPLAGAEAALARAVLLFVGDVGAEPARRLAALAGRQRIFVNVIDNAALSSAIMGAVVDRAPVVVAIASNGASPALVRNIRQSIERVLPQGLGRLARFAEGLRKRVADSFADAMARRRFWNDFLDGAGADAVLAGDEAGAERAVAALLAGEGQGEGRVHLVGAGPGDPELLTLRAQRLLGRADVIVHDRLVGREILDQARRDAETISVGKAKGCHSSTQDEINALLLALARQGKRVVRLKGGDPFLFGRGGEEMAHLKAHGIAVDVVPGISAAFGCAAAAEIPLTHRGLSQSVTLISGHGRSGRPELDLARLAGVEGTLVAFMALSVAATIADGLIAAGKPADTPVAVIERGTQPDEKRAFGTLGGLAALVAEAGIEGPAIIIIGPVAAFRV